MLPRFPARPGAMSSSPAFQEQQERLQIWEVQLPRQDMSVADVFRDADGGALTLVAEASDYGSSG